MRRESWTSFGRGGTTWVVVAHRGASSKHSENSTAAFEAAIAAGASAVETDVRRTADGVFVCHHDETLQRTAGVEQAIADVSFAELRRLAPGAALPLADVLDGLRGRINLLLDVKLGAEADLVALMDVLGGFGADDTVAIGVRSLATQQLVGQHAPGMVQLGLLEDPDDNAAFVGAGGRWVRLWERDVFAARVEAIQALGAPVLAMVGGNGTGRAVADIDRGGVAALRALGVDGLMLNEPGLALG